MLTGKRVFEDEDVSLTLSKVLRLDPDLAPLPADAPGRVRQVITACLRKDPKQRVRDVGDVRLALEGAFETGASVGTTVTSAWRVWQRSIPLVAAILAVALAGSIGLWVLKPIATGMQRPVRFAHILPEGQTFTRAGRPLLAVSP